MRRGVLMGCPGAATAGSDRACMMVTGWGVKIVFTLHMLHCELFLEAFWVRDDSMMLKNHIGTSANHLLGIKLGDFHFSAARSAAAYGDAFTAFFPSSHLDISSPFGPHPKFDPPGDSPG